MKRATIVIDSAFGDCGKGLMTDFHAAMASVTASPLVVRFNGGAQAGHTVVTPDGRRHVFSHFGAGAFAGAATYLSRHFIVNPICWEIELAKIETLGLSAYIHVDPDALVTTPYDMMVNQIIEDARGITRHGSCGMGINETIERSGLSEWCIRAADLMVPGRIAAKMQAIYNDYLPFRIAALGLELTKAQSESFASPVLISRFVEICAKMKGKIFINDAAILNSYGDIIFEGAQGLLLDQDHEFFPHVTRSNTGLKNVAEILDDFDTVETRVDYVVRAYMTRHGSGPFPSQADDLVYEDLTNRPNPWQGSLRFGAFDTRLVVSAIKKDIAANAITGMKTRLVMTHTDQVAGGAPALVDDQVQLVNWHYIADTVVFDARLDDMAHSNGPTRDNVNIAF